MRPLAVTRYCLDTSAYFRFRLGEPAATELIDSEFYVCLPSIAVGELFAGLRLGAHERRNTTELWDFLADPATDILGVDVHVAERYSLICGSEKKRNTDSHQRHVDCGDRIGQRDDDPDF